MKKILITGENSYIGVSFEKYMKEFPNEYQVDTLSVRNEEWKGADFSPYDTIFHVAGIAHADVGKVSEEGKKLYYSVNRDLTVAVAEKFKKAAEKERKEKQFIFMSSIIVYGENTSVNKKRIVTRYTEPNPSSFYGDSKLQAEKGLAPLTSEYFKIVILRPPMIYGPGSKGNYPELAKLAMKMPFFPDVKNERSMLFVGNLTIFLKKVIDENLCGVFLPQNNEVVRTSLLVKEIARVHGKNVVLFSWLNWAVKLLGYVPGKIGGLTNKAFGNLVIQSSENSDNQVLFVKTVKLTEKVGVEN